MSEFSIRILPEGRTYEAHRRVALALAATACDIWLEQPCGAKQTCGRCRVRVVDGRAEISPADARLLKEEDLQAGWRLSCCLELAGPTVIEVPAAARSVAAKPFGSEELFAGGLQLPPELRGMIGTGLAAAYGVAVDLGSTTLAAALVELQSGRVVHAISRLNPQVRHGADVISRIHFAQENEGGSGQLQRVLLGALREMIQELTAQARISPAQICEIALCGNATMTHTALGASIVSLGQAPYLGLWTEEQAIPAKELDLPANEQAMARLLPLIRSHVGGDTVAAILAAGLDQVDGWRLLIDLGTNSEIVLGSRQRMVATSTAAGPAFEGATISCGMRAAPGAIEAVSISPEGEVIFKTIGHEPARGICGSGLVDAVSELLRVGVITSSGFMKPREQLAALPRSLIERSRRLENGQLAFALDGKVLLTAHDVRQLQLVKGAICAGAELLMAHCGVRAEDLEEVVIAGAFGNFLRKTSLLAIGLVPAVEAEKVRFAGNAAGVGARMFLADATSRQRARKIAERCEYVELAGHPEYEDVFCKTIPFPERAADEIAR